VVPEADARLIAAAPELLAALKRLMEQKTENPIRLTSDERGALWEAHNLARNAIAKAEGRNGDD
jgi:hypothetical protein